MSIWHQAKATEQKRGTMHRIEYRIGQEPQPYKRDVERLRERTRAARQGYNLPPEELEPQPRKSGQEALGGFTATPRDSVPADREPEDLPDCELSYAQLSEVGAQEAKVIYQKGKTVKLKTIDTGRGSKILTAHCENRVAKGDTIYIIVAMSGTFAEKIKILGRKKEGD